MSVQRCHKHTSPVLEEWEDNCFYRHRASSFVFSHLLKGLKGLNFYLETMYWGDAEKDTNI